MCGEGYPIDFPHGGKEKWDAILDASAKIQKAYNSPYPLSSLVEPIAQLRELLRGD